MGTYKRLKIVVLFVCIFECALLFFNVNNFAYGKDNLEKKATTVKVDREPRIKMYRKNKENYILILHDNAGIDLNKTSVTFDGKNCKLFLIETTNENKENSGVYNKNGQRIVDIQKKGEKYTGKRYDYGIKIKSSSLSTEKEKYISIVAYDYGGNCYLKEKFKIKKLKKANKNGEYYESNIAPRTTSKIVKDKVNIFSNDRSGIKSIKVYSSKTNEEIFTYSAENGKKVSLKNGSSNSGYVKDKILYPYDVTKPISLEKAKIGENQYKIKVVEVDRAGVMSEKTSIIKTNNITAHKINDVYKAIQEVAFSYYMRGYRMQYNTSKRVKEPILPEQVTYQNRGYIVCSGFIRNVYNELLGIKTPLLTKDLYKYAEKNVGSPEVVAFTKIENKKMKIKFYENGNAKGESDIKFITDNNDQYINYSNIIPKLKIGDIITIVKNSNKLGHTIMVYDLVKDKNGRVIDAIVMESVGRGIYVNSKIGKTQKLGKKYGNVSFGKTTDALYFYSSNNKLYGFNEGTIKASSLNDRKDNFNKDKELFVLRFIQGDESGNAVLNYKCADITGEKNHNNEIINLKDSVRDRVNYSHLFIEKSVDKYANNIVEENSNLTYKIVVKNNSKKNYSNDITVTEKIPDFVTYKNNNYKLSKNNIIVTEDINNKEIKFNIGKLKSGEEITIRYTVKVNSNTNGKIIESKGTVGNISSGVIKNKVGRKLTDTQKNKITYSYNSLKSKYNGKKLVNEIYKDALGIDLKFDKFKIDNNELIISNKENNSIYLNKSHKYYNCVLNNYYGGLKERQIKNKNKQIIDANGKAVIEYTQKKWSEYSSEDRRADTIYRQHFETGDILIYTNKNDVIYETNSDSITNKKITYENGEYAYIYIEGKGFVGVNLGNDGKIGTSDDRNEFNSKYYTNKKLQLFSDGKEHEKIREFSNFQSLYGKDYYIILRPSLEM